MDCAHVADGNRDGKSFACEECGYAVDADVNAAKNIAYRYIREEFYGDELDHDAGEDWFDVVEQAERHGERCWRLGGAHAPGETGRPGPRVRGCGESTGPSDDVRVREGRG